MRIDETQRPWIAATILLFAIATGIYLPYALLTKGGPRGGTALGLLYGTLGYGMMLFAGLLGARKKFPIIRVGRAQTWMRGHLWLGLLSFPYILYHSGFMWRGSLTAWLMLLFLIVWISGIAGAVIQHLVPRYMATQVPLETIYEEIPHVRQQLRDEADQLAVSICGQLEQREMAESATTGEPQPAVATATLAEIEVADRARFREVYLQRVKPFLENPEARSELSTPQTAAAAFESMRRLLPKPVHAVVDDLESICEEERQLVRQRKIYQWMHGWLIVHVPLSIALLVLGGIHAIVALTY
jgi:hypothetical protein